MAKETIVETRGSGGNGIALVLLAVAIVIAAFVGFMFLANDTKETNAVTGAAQSVGQAADSVGEAVPAPAAK